MVLEELGIAFIGAIMGSIASFGFFYKWELDKEKTEKIRIRKVINDDFYRMYSHAKNMQDFILSLLKNDKNEFDDLVWTVFDESRKKNYVFMLDFQQAFLLWNSIVSSGSLVKLESDEIQLINSTHDFIESVIEANKKEYENYTNLFWKSFDGNNKSHPLEMIKVVLEAFLNISYINLNEIKTRFDYLCTNIAWMKPEFSTDKLAEINPFYEPQETGRLWWLPSPKDKEFERKTPI